MKTIKITQGLETIVDDDDYEELSKHKWCILGKDETYVCRMESTNGKRYKVLLHRAIMKAPKGLQVDHINRNVLDNRKCNLRLCSYSGNSSNRGIMPRNKSGYIGVSLIKLKTPKWQSCVRYNKKNYYLGLFKSKEEAAKARDKKVLELHGEFASLNFINVKHDLEQMK